MRPFSLLSTLLHYLFCLLIAVFAILAPLESYAQYDGPRNSTYKSNSGMCDTSNGNKYIAFDPYGGNIDYEFDMIGNPFCRDISLGVGAAAVSASLAASLQCRLAATCSANRPAAEAEEKQEAFIGPLLPAPGPNWPLKIALKIGACSSRTAVNTVCCATPNPTTCAAGTYDTLTCCTAVLSFLASVSAVMSSLAVQYGEAHQAYDNARICGHNWYSWRQLDSDGLESPDGIWTKVKGKYQNCLRNLFLGEENTFIVDGCNGKSKEADIKNKYYREYIYGGIEFEDTNGCTNPKTWDKNRRIEILGYTSDPQRYYMTGPGSASSFSCRRFLAAPKKTEKYNENQDYAAMQKSYECCVKRSQNAICIENKGGSKDVNNVVTGEKNYEHKFCEIGDVSCHVGSVDFEIYESTSAVNYVCAKTYSACPYNHLLGGGTEKADRDPSGNTKNYCQYLNHCSKRPLIPYVRTSSLQSAYIDNSCKNLKGDTQNTFSYQSELLSINAKGFTAPIVQCVKETMQNMFLNKAGFTECINPDEVPDQNGKCLSGEAFEKGKELTDQKSFFEKLRDRFQLLIRIVLTFSVLMFGAMLLFASPNTRVERKKLFPYILKIALVVYFTLGDAWQGVFVEGVLNASGYLATITFKPEDQSLGTNKLDGCQFPRFNYKETEESIERYYPVNSQGQRDDSLLSYPPGKEYLQIWDALDCKIALALGLGVEASIPNLIMMILGGFLTAGFGIVFVVISFSFAFFIIFLSIRAMQFFLVAMLSVVLLIYFSTFIIPLSLFERTKSIFNNWWKNLLSFTLQPMILFAYLGVLIAIFDNVVMGSATFSPATVTINEVSKVDDYGRISPKTISCNDAAKNDSIYCIFKIADIKTYNGLEALGIGLPMLASVNAEKLMTLAKAALIMFVFSKFMDKINTIASELTNGTNISTGWENSASPTKMGKEMYDKLRGAQKRGMRGTKKAIRAGIDMAKDSKKSKKDDASEKSESTDSVGKGSGRDGGEDSVGKKGLEKSEAEDSVGTSDKGGEGDGVGPKAEPATGTTTDKDTEGKGSEGGDESSAKPATGSVPSKDTEGKGGGKKDGGEGEGGEGEEKEESEESDGEEDKESGQERPDGPEGQQDNEEKGEEKKGGSEEKGEEKGEEKKGGEEKSKGEDGDKGGKEENSASASAPKNSDSTSSSSAGADSSAAASSSEASGGGSASANSSSAASGGGAESSAATASSSASSASSSASASAASSGGSGGNSGSSASAATAAASSSTPSSEKSTSGGESKSPETPSAENPEDNKNDPQQSSDAPSAPPEKPAAAQAAAPSSPSSSAAASDENKETPSDKNAAAPEETASGGDDNTSGESSSESSSSDANGGSESQSDQSGESSEQSGDSTNSDQDDAGSSNESSAQEQEAPASPSTASSAQSNQQNNAPPPPPPPAKTSVNKKRSSLNHSKPNLNQSSRLNKSNKATDSHKKAGEEIRKKSTVQIKRTGKSSPSEIKNHKTPNYAAEAAKKGKGGHQTPTASSSAKQVRPGASNSKK